MTLYGSTLGWHVRFIRSAQWVFSKTVCIIEIACSMIVNAVRISHICYLNLACCLYCNEIHMCKSHDGSFSSHREYFEDVDRSWETFEKTLWEHIANFFKLSKERY